MKTELVSEFGFSGVRSFCVLGLVLTLYLVKSALIYFDEYLYDLSENLLSCFDAHYLQ